MQTKVCNICKKRKRTTSFYANPNHEDGLLPTCKPCQIERAKPRGKARAEAIRRLIAQHPLEFRILYRNVLNEMEIE